MDKVRAEITVITAGVAYPSDSGLLAKAVGKIPRTVRRVKAAGVAGRTPTRGRRRAVGRRARAIARKLKLRGQLQRDDAQAVVRRTTGELAGLAATSVREARAEVRNGRRGLSKVGGRVRAQLGQALHELEVTLAGPSRSSPTPAAASPGRCQRARPGWSACTIWTPGRSAKAASASRWSSVRRRRLSTTLMGSSSPHRSVQFV